MRGPCFKAIVLLAGALLTIYGGPGGAYPRGAMAADLDAEEFAKAVTETIATFHPDRHQTLGLTIDGEPRVSGRDGRYSAVLSRLALHIDDGILSLGDATLTIETLTGPDYRFFLTMRPEVRLGEKDDSRQTVMRTGSRRIEGVWNNDLKTVTELDVDLGGLVLIDLETGRETVRVKRLRYGGGVEETAPGLWSGGIGLKLEAFGLASGLELGAFVMSAKTTGLRLADQNSALKELLGANHVLTWHFGGRFIPQQVFDFALDQEQFKAAFEKLSEPRNLGSNTNSLLVEIDDLMLGTDDDGDFRLGYGTLHLMGATSAEGTTNLSLQVSVDGVELDEKRIKTSDIGDLIPYLPRRLHLNLDLADVPSNPLDHLLRQYLGPILTELMTLEESLPPQERERREQEILGKGSEQLTALWLALTDAGTEAEIPDSLVQADTYRLFLGGRVRADGKSTYGGTGEVEVELEWSDEMDELIKRLSGSPEKKELLSILTLLQLMGTQVPLPGGPARYRYVINHDGSGKTTVNGVDMTPILTSFEE